MIMPARLLQVQIQNYKSIERLSASLEPFTILAGANGAGKTNFIDALAFVHDCLSDSIERAFKRRGGARAVLRPSNGDPTHVGFRFMMDLGEAGRADYSFELSVKVPDTFKVIRERCVIGTDEGERAAFEVHDGKFTREIEGIRPQIAPGRLALFAASATEEFRPVYDFISTMRFYSINPERLREPQDADPGECLKRDGRNAAAVLKRLATESPDEHARLSEILCHIIGGGLKRIECQLNGRNAELKFHQDTGQKDPWIFDARNMSDGTLRALGVLLAAMQPGHHSFISIEEPEATIAAGSAEAMLEVLMNASSERQVLLTTHSPDILDCTGLSVEQLRITLLHNHKTIIAPLSGEGRETLEKRLSTAGELLRVNELSPNLDEALDAAERMDLFGPTNLQAAATQK